MADLGTSEVNRFAGHRLPPRARALLLFGAIVALGLALGVLNVPLASSAANAVDVEHITQAAPTDPQATLWADVPEVAIPLSAQQMQQPGGGTTREVRVRAVEDGQTFAIRVSWDDETLNDDIGAIPSDAAAIQLPIDPAHLPYQCMGQSNSRVNIWQWKAGLERVAQDNLTATAVEGGGTLNLTSNGICKAADTYGIGPQAKSHHDGKQWHLVFWRKLYKGDLVTAPLIREASTSIAFAIWNGASGETRGMKAVSTWNTLAFKTPPVDNTGNLVALAAVVLVSVGAVGWAIRRYAR